MSQHRFIRACLRQPVDRTPVWIMRQAGRYLPEYRALRAQVPDFMTFCKTPDLACEVTLQPLKRFALDAAILFSDILTVPEAMGMELQFVSGHGPQFTQPLTNVKAIEELQDQDLLQRLSYVTDAVKLIKHELSGSLPLIGFAGSPWTLACYMIEGQGSKDFASAKKLMYADPKSLHLLLEKLTAATVEYLNAQIAAGVDAIMLFDTWGGLLTPTTYRQFSLAYMQQIISQLNLQHGGNKIPAIIFTKSAGLWLEHIANTSCDVVGLDWTIDIAAAKARIGDKVALQGNLDPAVLYAEPRVIEREVRMIIEAFGPHPGHIFNLGHGITPQVDPESVACCVNAVHNHSYELLKNKIEV